MNVQRERDFENRLAFDNNIGDVNEKIQYFLYRMGTRRYKMGGCVVASCKSEPKV